MARNDEKKGLEQLRDDAIHDEVGYTCTLIQCTLGFLSVGLQVRIFTIRPNGGARGLY